jgi:putative ABC transport system substrate-binding protein
MLLSRHTSRREFIAVLGGAAAGWLLAARAQQPGKLSTIGFLGVGSTTGGAATAPFLRRLGELGWVEGRNITIDYRWMERRPEAAREFLAEFVRLVIHTI